MSRYKLLYRPRRRGPAAPVPQPPLRALPPSRLDHGRHRCSATDIYGAPVRCRVRVCEAGPFLVLKLIAFAQRRQPKDAFDLHQFALHYDGGATTAIAAFAAERDVNSGYALARATLADHFTTDNASGPLRGAAFVFGENPANPTTADEHLRFREELVNFGQALLEAT